MTDPSIRHLTAADGQDRREFAHYTRLDVARGDFGFAAEQNGTAIGAGWAVFLPAEDAGYGFVDMQTPELSLWIHAKARGHGLGRHLLRLLKSEARRRGIPGLSLSVESGNFAHQLYEDEGFRHVRGREADGVRFWASDEARAEPT